MAKKQTNWIQKAIKSPGALTKQAKKAKMSTQKFADQVLKNPEDHTPKTVRRARLAKTLQKLSKKRTK
jgi:hypothetical protein